MRRRLTDRYLDEVIAIPGFRDVFITRGDNYRAMIDAGYDAATADMFSFGPNQRSEIDAAPHPAAYRIARDVNVGSFQSIDDYTA